MSYFYEKTKLSFAEAEERFNNRLRNLEVISVQNGVSNSNRLYLTIFSQKHDQNYELSVGTEKWTWKDASNKEIPVFKDEYNEHSMHPISSEIETFLKNKLIVNKVELKKKSMQFRLFFNNDTVLEAQEDISSEDRTHYQLMLFGSKLYQNYNLLIEDNTCIEEITDAKEEGKYKVAMFDLDYFRTEHRNFTTHAIRQARERISPISFLQASVLYQALTRRDPLTFFLWSLRRSFVERTRLDTIPIKELISITREECKRNNFSIKEAEDILKSTFSSYREWFKTEKNLSRISDQEYGIPNNFRNLIQWYEETFGTARDLES